MRYLVPTEAIENFAEKILQRHPDVTSNLGGSIQTQASTLLRHVCASRCVKAGSNCMGFTLDPESGTCEIKSCVNLEGVAEWAGPGDLYTDKAYTFQNLALGKL